MMNRESMELKSQCQSDALLDENSLRRLLVILVRGSGHDSNQLEPSPACITTNTGSTNKTVAAAATTTTGARGSDVS